MLATVLLWLNLNIVVTVICWNQIEGFRTVYGAISSMTAASKSETVGFELIKKNN